MMICSSSSSGNAETATTGPGRVGEAFGLEYCEGPAGDEVESVLSQPFRSESPSASSIATGYVPLGSRSLLARMQSDLNLEVHSHSLVGFVRGGGEADSQ